MNIVHSNSTQDTIQIVYSLLPLIIKRKIVCFTGDLGSGKTFMCQQIVRNLLNDQDAIITSPTFPLLKTYQSNEHGLIYHYDLYRAKSLIELEEIGFLDTINRASNICLIEWPQIAKHFIEVGLFLDISIMHIAQDSRQIHWI